MTPRKDARSSDYEARLLLVKVKRLSKLVSEYDRRATHARLSLVQAMREARESHTLEEIGNAAGLSKQRVHELLKS